MLTEIYIEALLVDEELADQVWEAWDKGEIDDQVACIAWWLIVERPLLAESGPSKQLVFADLNVRFREKQTLPFCFVAQNYS